MSRINSKKQKRIDAKKRLEKRLKKERKEKKKLTNENIK